MKLWEVVEYTSTKVSDILHPGVLQSELGYTKTEVYQLFIQRRILY